MSYRALYRKYRPKVFSDIIGQPGIVQALAGQVAGGRISHAYLFSGPRGTGKTSAAKVLARAINCADNQNGEACGKCRPCVELLGDTNMDIAEIDAASNNSVDKVREMLENVKYMPAVGKYRVYIVDEVHMLSTSAFNALLKTLEEPPAHVVFILATTEPHKLPATVLSRCQQFQFHRIGAADMVKLLEGVLKQENATADPEALSAIARAAEGGMRDALSLLDQCLSLGGGHVSKQQVLGMLGTADSAAYFKMAECLLSGDAAGAVEGLDAFIESGGDVRTFAQDLCRHMRDMFIASYVKNPADILDVSREDAAELAAQAGRYAPGDILKCLGLLSELDGALRYAANPRVTMELALFRCCRTEKTASYDALLSRVERLEAMLNSGEVPLRERPAPRPADEAPVARELPEEVPPPPEPSEEEVPWLEAEVPYAPRPVSVAVPEPFASPALFEEGWDEADEKEVPESLPGQMDLFAGAGIEAPERKSVMPAGKLWHAALERLRDLPQILAFAGKGKAQDFDGNTLTLSFTEDDKGAAKMLEDERRMGKLRAAVEGVTGSPVRIRLEVTEWSPAQQQFIERSRAVIPKDATIIIEKDI